MVDADPSADHAHANQVAVGAQSVYDAVAEAYNRQRQLIGA
jgi:hypothetical protein